MEIGNTNVDFGKLRERLDDPRQLRALVTGLILAVGFVGVYMPLSGRIDKTARELDKEERRLALAGEIEQLRAQVDSFQARLPEDTDTNEWIQYVLAGIRKFPVVLVKLDPDEPQRVGPYEAVVLHLEIVGEYQNLDSFLDWIEANERLFRVDSVKIMPPRGGGNHLLMQLAVQGVKG
ncbi:MAG: type 4a pilus biogenesis protein PilO [Planctomycetota bacterium]